MDAPLLTVAAFTIAAGGYGFSLLIGSFIPSKDAAIAISNIISLLVGIVAVLAYVLSLAPQ